MCPPVLFSIFKTLLVPFHIHYMVSRVRMGKHIVMEISNCFHMSEVQEHVPSLYVKLLIV